MTETLTPPAWFQLDNAAKIYPANYSEHAPEVFRVGATLDEPVQLSAMERALERTVARCPYYQVHLRRGLFWYYLERHETPPRIDLLQSASVSRIRMRERYEQLFRVFVRDRRVRVDFSHVLTDGSGAFRFLCTLVAEYLRQRGIAVPAGDLVLDTDQPPSEQEFSDAYRELYIRGVPKPDRMGPAFHISGLMVPGYHRIISAKLPASQVRDRAREFGATITEFLAGVYVHALYAMWEAGGRTPRNRKAIRLEVPVDMRRIHPTETMRNFSLFISPGIDLRLAPFTLEDIIRTVHHSMRLQLDLREIRRQIARNVGGEFNPLVRVIPLLLKDWYLSSLHHRLGPNISSGVISNFGNITLPEELGAHVTDLTFLLGPNVGLRKAVSVIGYRGTLNIVIGSVIESREFERLYFTTLADLGLNVSISEQRL